MDLTDEQWWSVIQPLIPDLPRRPDGKGRPWRDSREVMNGILWVLRTGACWYDLPERYPPYQTCHRRFQQWVRSELFERILQALAADLRERGGRDLSECHIDGTFVIAKKGGTRLERPSGGARYEGHGNNIRQCWSSCRRTRYVYCFSPHEVTLAEAAVAKCFVADKPERLIGDRAYDSDPLDVKMAVEHGIELIAPHRLLSGWRKRPTTQDGRVLRRYKRRWKVERLFLHGRRISGVYRYATTIMQRTFWVLSSLDACSSCFGGVYEMTTSK